MISIKFHDGITENFKSVDDAIKFLYFYKDIVLENYTTDTRIMEKVLREKKNKAC